MLALSGWSRDVLTYRPGKRRDSRTVRRHYELWRKEHGKPLDRCDRHGCPFNASEPIWCGQRLLLELSHKDGAATNNHPNNLEFLCPNCHSQEADTRGGANANRIEQSSGGYSRRRPRSKLRDYHLIADPGSFRIGQNSDASKAPPRRKRDGRSKRR
jgi:hypothetical protein